MRLFISLLLVLGVTGVHQLQAQCDADAGTDASVILGDAFSLSANIPTGSQTAVWEVLSGGATIDSINSPTSPVSGLTLGTHEFEWKISQSPVDSSGSIEFNGFSSHISIPDHASLDGGTNFTLEAWVNLANSVSDQKIMGKTTGSFNGGYLLGVQTSNIYPEFWDVNGTNHTFKLGTVPSNQWVHLAVTWESGAHLIGYINGAEVGRVAASANALGTNTNNFYLGAAPWDQNFFIVDGLMDEFRVWGATLDSATIGYWKDYSVDNSHPNHANLISYYTMQAGSGLTIYDQKGSNDGAITNCTWSTSTPAPFTNIQPACADSDVVVITVTEDMTSIEESSNSSEIKVFPNPTDDYVNIRFTPNNSNAHVQLIDSQGRIVHSAWVDKLQANIQFDVKGLSPGLYNILLQRGQDRFSQAIVIQ